MIADAGHELRTPLTSLRTNIELLAADASSGMLKQQDRIDILADVKAQLVEFTALIGDLVELARDETAASPEPLDFRNVVNSALDRIRLRAHGLLFDVELNPFYVVGDSDMLERAITNLLDNAVKWSPPGGTIRVQLEGDRLRVADQGPGIGEGEMPFIFDRFYRGDTARQTPGTGLGLSIVAQTITQHGGWVRAGRSAQGGAEFTIRLPGATSLEELTEPTEASRVGSSVAHAPTCCLAYWSTRRLARWRTPCGKWSQAAQLSGTLTSCSRVPTPSSPAVLRAPSISPVLCTASSCSRRSEQLVIAPSCQNPAVL